jgi:hypothetical protein
VVSKGFILTARGSNSCEDLAYLSRLERADERTRTADLLITSELLKSRESNLRCFSLLLASQHSIRRHLLETHLLRAVGQ